MPKRRFQARITLVTPTFLGGLRHDAQGIRPASLKGALRFWWRALGYAALARQVGSEAAALRELRAREIDLFGAAGVSGDERLGRSRVEVRARWSPPGSRPRFLVAKSLLSEKGRMPGAEYLGYGVVGAAGDDAGRLLRSALAPDGEFDVAITLRKGASEEEAESVLRAFRLLGLMGGLGNRARRGYGSLAMLALGGDCDAERLPEDGAAYATRLQGLLSPCQELAEEPPISTFAASSRVEIVAQDNDPLALLDRVGRQMQRYRGWGHNGRVNGLRREENFRDDHDWFKAAIGNGPAARAPDRAAFGLPHNYYSIADREKVEVEPKDRGRRASPLLIHLHPTIRGGCFALLTRLSGQFLPEGEALALTARGRTVHAAQREDDWRTILDEFFDGPPARALGGLGPYFPLEQRRRVMPAPGASAG